MKSSWTLILATIAAGGLCGAGYHARTSITLSAQSPAQAAGEPSPQPRLFAEGIITTNTDEFGATFSPDGKTVFLSKSVPRSNFYTICFSQLTNGRWPTPEIAPFSGQYWDFDAFFSPDGSKLFFSSDRPVPGKEKPDQDFDIWMVEKTTAGWSEPRNLSAPVNSDANEPFASVTADGTLYFLSTRDTPNGPPAIYRARFENGAYRSAEKLAGNWGIAGYLGEVVVAPNEEFMLVSSFRGDGFGSQDIYISFRRNGAWSRILNLGPTVNTRAREYSPRLSPDGKRLFFTSERGFATAPLEQRLTLRGFQARLRSTLNGWGNIYQVDLEPLKQAALKQLEQR